MRCVCEIVTGGLCPAHFKNAASVLLSRLDFSVQFSGGDKHGTNGNYGTDEVGGIEGNRGQIVPPLQGWEDIGAIIPGRCFALPWAIVFRLVGA